MRESRYSTDICVCVYVCVSIVYVTFAFTSIYRSRRDKVVRENVGVAAMKIELETWRDVKHTACLYATSGVRRRRERSVATLHRVQRVQLPLFPEARDNPGSFPARPGYVRMEYMKLNFASPVTPL